MADALATREPALLAAQLTLLALLLAPVGVLDARAWMLIVACLGLLLPRLAASWQLWAAATLLAAARVVRDWPLPDNHAYLLAYWSLALALAFAAVPQGPTLARAARLLLAAVFTLATLQKLLSPEYVDGTFFRWLLADDPRFESLGLLLGRDADALASTRALLATPPWEELPAPARFVEPPALAAAAWVLTWATVVMEGVTAAAFLAPTRLLGWLRDPALLAFCAGTYALAPVAGFGWILLAMGVAQCAPARRRTRLAYLAAFALLVFYEEVPWLDLWAGA